MPGPPTPVCGCPLKRLEIHDGGATRVYRTSRPNNVFTLTLEGERLITANSSTLVFLVHHESRQLISIRLHDLIKNCENSSEMIGVRPEKHEMYIKFPGKSHAILAQLEEKRDFSIALYMLKRSNLHINYTIPRGFSTSVATMTAFPSTSLDFQTASMFGPRLSSMTYVPPNTSARLELEQETSFTELLNSPLPFPSSQPVAVHHSQSSQRMHSLPEYVSQLPSTPFNLGSVSQQLNTSSFVPGRTSSQVYAPWMGSPLKQTFRPEEASIQPSFSSVSASLQQNNGCANMNIDHIIPRPPLIDSTASKKCDQVHTIGASDKERHIRFTTTTSSIERTSSSPDPGSIELAMNFRDLMPKPRKLPFNLGPKIPVLAKKESTKGIEVKDRSDVLKRKAIEDLSTGFNSSGSLNDSHLTCSEIRTFPGRSPRVAVNVESETNSTPGPDFSRTSTHISRWSDSPSVPVQYESAVLVTDSDTLDHINQLTSRLFDQYTTDLESGANPKGLAKFYMEKIMSTRTEFWLTSLEEMSFR